MQSSIVYVSDPLSKKHNLSTKASWNSQWTANNHANNMNSYVMQKIDK